jgi:hypothetical protein
MISCLFSVSILLTSIYHTNMFTLTTVKANMEADEKDRLPEDQLLGQMKSVQETG